MSAFACPSTEYVKGLTKVKEKMIKMQKNITNDKCTLEVYQEFAGRGSLRRLQMTGKRTPDRRTNEIDNNVYREKCPERSSL